MHWLALRHIETRHDMAFLRITDVSITLWFSLFFRNMLLHLNIKHKDYSREYRLLICNMYVFVAVAIVSIISYCNYIYSSRHTPKMVHLHILKYHVNWYVLVILIHIGVSV